MLVRKHQHKANLSPFSQVGDHDDDGAILLPNQAPEIPKGVGQRTLRCHIGLWFVVPLQGINISEGDQLTVSILSNLHPHNLH
jgi:hypothetical protein